MQRKNIINKLVVAFLFSIIMSSCTTTTIKDIVSNFNINSEAPAGIKEAIATRVNPEKEIYALGSASLGKSGPIVAQSFANKEASDNIKKQVTREVNTIYKSYLLEMDAYSKSIINPVLSDLSSYSTDLIMRKTTQKGAWEDASKVYSLLAVDRSEIETISSRVFRNFISNASKKLENINSSIK